MILLKGSQVEKIASYAAFSISSLAVSIPPGIRTASIYIAAPGAVADSEATAAEDQIAAIGISSRWKIPSYDNIDPDYPFEASI